jgi:cytochrome c553
MLKIKTLAALTAIAALLGAAPAAIAKGSAEAGANKAATCLACHGPNGNSVNPEWPSLAGQNAAYIEEQTKLFRANKRLNPNMNPQVAGLSDEDIADIAAYYASQVPTGLEADPSYWRDGEKLYRSGDAKRNIPACKACHGPVGRGNPGSGYPAVRAQHSVYTVKQLNDYAAENRYRDSEGKVHSARHSRMMVDISKRLTAEDIRNLASYLQGMR